MDHIEQATAAPGEARDLPSQVVEALAELDGMHYFSVQITKVNNGFETDVTVTISGRR